MILVETYKGYHIHDSGLGYFLLMKRGEWDYIQHGFSTIQEARDYVDEGAN